jgi:hypothetical protein
VVWGRGAVCSRILGTARPLPPPTLRRRPPALPCTQAGVRRMCDPAGPPAAATASEPGLDSSAAELSAVLIDDSDAQLRALLAAIASVASPPGDEAVHFAAGRGEVACLQALLAGGASIDAVGVAPLMKGATPLMAATVGTHVACVEALLAAGAHTETTQQHSAYVRSMPGSDSMRGGTVSSRRQH